ncbi:MAG: hypothetical protein D8M58_04120 [Calditrichaeota bacterium]|nr:MAG: hypothetical protein DWQ03_02955 [Calditrichota bacterium]MBL1204555.1 hypothetical protein [Calditrichota bacterium]NOG44383.1 hypothetical protein [Calditrichota bacterium]
MLASDDAGVTYNLSADSTSEDIGADILSGIGKHIVWDFGAEHPQIYNDQIQVKIIANDNFDEPETGTVTDIDGNVYKTVKIGDQWWMAENLKVTRYSNGEAIPNVTDNSEWSNLSTGAYCAYENADSNISIYGLLYNWYAVLDARNIAPAGWHIPTDEEWKELEMHLGMSQSEADDTFWRGTDEGSKLKSESGWYNNGNSTNLSGFSALPGGYRNYSSGSFSFLSNDGLWWSSTEFYSYYVWSRDLHYNHSDVHRGGNDVRSGFSVRCVRD